jgi:hypothetical protein
MRTKAAFLGLMASLAVAAAPASANPIVIFNTGVDAFGAPLPDGSVDSHWEIISGTVAFPGPNAYVTNFGYPISPGVWVANDASSKWISPAANANQEFGWGTTFVYRTAFDLSGLAETTASLSGLWASDNQTLQILLNGVDTGIGYNCANSASDTSCFTTLHAFSIPVGASFVSGVNTLDFVVRNGVDDLIGGPSGLRVQIAGSADPVPEPGVLWLLGSGIVGLAMRRRGGRQTKGVTS